MAPYTKTHKKNAMPDGDDGWLVTEADGTVLAVCLTETIAEIVMWGLLTGPEEVPNYEADKPYGEPEETQEDTNEEEDS
jgi:hypothetical protein